MASGFVSPEEVHLELTGGNWLSVKRELSVGEERRIFARCVKTARAGEKVELDLEQVGKTKLVEYILEWGGPSFQDTNGKTRKFSATALDDLRTSLFNEISRAVDEHELEEERKRVEVKNDQDGAISTDPISPSVN
jgi:hypothetical protein